MPRPGRAVALIYAGGMIPLLLFAVFIVLPLLELYVIIEVAGAIGLLPTLGLLLLDGFIGAALARSQGRIAWQRFNAAMSEGRVPAREVFDGAMIMFGGALLLSPGFLTDVLGIGLLLPPGRAAIRGLLKRAAKRTPQGRPIFYVYDRMPGTGRRAGADSQGKASSSPPRPASGRRGWDVEGSAREIDDDRDLPAGDPR